ncbi:hypothetical protein Dimus_000234 [Dionaea muscipula]
MVVNENTDSIIFFTFFHNICQKQKKKKKKGSSSSMALPPVSSSTTSSPPRSSDSKWASLPETIFHIILNKLMLLSDLARFGAVCSHWRSAAMLRLHQLNVSVDMYFNSQLPLLLIPTEDNSETRRDVFSVTHGRIYSLRLPVPYSKRCSGSSHGWLITIDSQTSVITLMNPFFFGNSRGTINLPRFLEPSTPPDADLDEFININYEYLISKAILSADPIGDPDDYAIMVIYGDMRRLAFCRSGDEDWTCMEEVHDMFQDVIFRSGHFLAVNQEGEVYCCDIISDPPRAKLVLPSIGTTLRNYSRRYIVKTPNGNILQIARLVENTTTSTGEPVASTYGFFVFKMVVLDGVLGWEAEASLGNGSLFLGDNHSTYVDASRFPGCQENCIYFTDDFHDIYTMYHLPYRAYGPCDTGIYKLKDHSFDDFYTPNYSQRHMPPPIWLLPTI